MILGFKDQFIPYIEEGSKTHTIRGGKRWKVGMRADLFRNVRQKNMRLIFRAPVVRVQEVEILHVTSDSIPTGDLAVFIDGCLLDPAEAEAFFWRDGFRKPDNVPSVNLAYGFWMGRLPFYGQIVHWDYAARFMEVPKKPKRARRRVAPKQHPCEYIDPVTLYDPPFGGTR